MATGDRLSIVVPSRGEGAGLARCLAALVRMEAADEIVVAAHGEPVRLARRARRCARLVWVDCPQPGRGLQMNAGACSAHGELLLFLHADTRLPRGAAGMVRAALADPRVAGGAFRLCFDARHPVLDLLARCSAVDWPGSFLGDQGLFCRRAQFGRTGGFWARPLFEDVDLARRLAREGRLVRLHAEVRTSARRFTAAGPWRQLARNAALYAGYRLGADVERLARAYRP